MHQEMQMRFVKEQTEITEKSVDYQVGHTTFGQEGHLIFEDHLLELNSFVLQEIL